MIKGRLKQNINTRLLEHMNAVKLIIERQNSPNELLRCMLDTSFKSVVRLTGLLWKQSTVLYVVGLTTNHTRRQVT